MLTSYEWDAKTKINRLKPDLREAQTQAIAHFNATDLRINATRTEKHPEKVAKAIAAGKAEPKLKLVPTLEPVIENVMAVVLDATILDNAVRHWKNHKGEAVYARVPGAMAQQVLNRLGDAFKGYFASLKQFNVDPVNMTGRPDFPSYLEKNERFVLEIPLAAVAAHLPSLKGKNVPVDYAETSSLTEDQLALFSSFDVIEMIEKTCKKRGWAEFQPQHLRIVPMNHGVKLEAVVRVKNAYPADSFLAKLIAQHGVELAECKKAKQRDEWLLQHLKALPAKEMPRVESIDLGVNNLATAAFNTGHKANVFTGARLDAVLGDLNDQIDARTSKLTPRRVRELQGKKNAAQERNKELNIKDDTLTKKEHIELNTLLSKVFNDPEYLRLIGKKNRWLDDFLHKTSHALVKGAIERKIDVIIIGRNKGWKQESNMGAQQNRRFCQLGHAKLIEMIKYKAEMAGIAVVTVEESYTSKTSFVNNEVLETFTTAPGALLPGQKSASPSPLQKQKRSGKRSSDDRNWFVHKNRNDRLKVVHADVNGAFNIIRKVFSHFKYHVKLTLKFTLFRLSPRLGMVPLQNLGLVR